MKSSTPNPLPSFNGIDKPNLRQVNLQLDDDIVWDSLTNRGNYRSLDSLLIINRGVWYICKGTKWDGITGFFDGKEDTSKPGYPVSWFASLIHDIGCLYWNTDSTFPYTRFRIDYFFYRLLKLIRHKFTVKIFKFKLNLFFIPELYYLAVTVFTLFKYTFRRFNCYF